MPPLQSDVKISIKSTDECFPAYLHPHPSLPQVLLFHSISVFTSKDTDYELPELHFIELFNTGYFVRSSVPRVILSLPCAPNVHVQFRNQKRHEMHSHVSYAWAHCGRYIQ